MTIKRAGDGCLSREAGFIASQRLRTGWSFLRDVDLADAFHPLFPS
jgi:hypothetical protein